MHFNQWERRGNLRRQENSPAKKQRRSERKKRLYLAELLEHRRLLSLTVPVYNSLPGAPYTIFLDFDGTAAMTWNNGDGHGNYQVHGSGGTSTSVPAFDIDGDPTTYSLKESSEIRSIWSAVSEKFSPFDVNVTTVDPGTYGDNQAVQCVIGGSTNDWYTQSAESAAGGVAAIGGFLISALPNTCFVFSADVEADDGTTRDHFLSESAAHEIGHEMGLRHQRSQPTAGGTINEYYAGDANKAPIMGGSSNNPTARGIWWDTNAIQSQQKSPDPVQDDLSDLYSVLGTRPDDHTASSPPTMFLRADGQFIGQSGVIEQFYDTDIFLFTPTTSRVSFSVVDNNGFGGMLAPNAGIVRQSDAAIMPSTLTTTNYSCSISSSSLTPNTTYELIVYNDGTYGSLGQYSITGAQQQFATYDPQTRFITVGGMDGNNNLTLSVVPSTPTNANDPGQLLISDSVNGGTPIQQEFQMAGLNFINVNLGSGSDTITINPTDALNGFSEHPGLNVDAGGGTNTLVLAKGNAVSDDFNVNSTIEIDMGDTDVAFHNIQSVFLDGNSSATNYYVNDWEYVCPLYLEGGNGSDFFYIEPQVMADTGSAITTDGNGGTDNLICDASTLGKSKSFNVFSNEITTLTDYGQRNINFSGTESLIVYGTAQSDGMSVYSLSSSTAVYFHAGNGDDTLTLGDSGDGLDLTNIQGNVYFYGDAGTDNGYIDDMAAAAAHTYVVDHTHIGTTVGGNLFNGGGVESLTIDGGDANGSTYDVFEGQPGVTLILNCGAGNDSINFDNATTWNAYAYGNGGFNTLTVDDRSGASAPSRADIRDVSVTHYYGATSYAIVYTNIGSATYYGAPTTNQANVLSTSSNIASGYQWTIVMNSGNDMVNVYPHNTVTGAATILSPLGILGGGGTDVVNVDDSADPTAVSYDIYNQYNNQTCNILGSGVGLGIAYDVETMNLMGGPGDDYFRLDTFETDNVLNIYGNGGNDTVDFTPSTKNAAAYLTALPTFDFVGGAGSDTMRFYNDNGTGPFTYIQTSTYFEPANTATNYFLILQNSGVETIYASGTPQADTISVNSMPTGATFQFTGGAGLDNVTINAGPVECPVSEDFGTLSIGAAGSLKMTGAHSGLIVRSTFTLSGKLDLNHSDLAIDYPSGSSPIGSWNGSAYTGTLGQVQTGRNGGNWNATGGITTSGVTSTTALGVAEASQALGLSGAQTKLFDGYTVDASTVLVKYTYRGDATMDGKINVDDYIKIDSGISTGLKAWFNGDFNYDGKINIDDYTTIDGTIGIQGAPLSSSSGIYDDDRAVTAVPLDQSARNNTDAWISRPQLSWSDASDDSSIWGADSLI